MKVMNLICPLSRMQIFIGSDEGFQGRKEFETEKQKP